MRPGAYKGNRGFKKFFKKYLSVYRNDSYLGKLVQPYIPNKVKVYNQEFLDQNIDGEVAKKYGWPLFRVPVYEKLLSKFMYSFK